MVLRSPMAGDPPIVRSHRGFDKHCAEIRRRYTRLVVTRTALAAILLVLLLPVAVLANASNWALRTVLDDRAFTTTVARVLETPALETALAQRATTLILDAVGDSELRLQALATGVLGLSGTDRATLETVLEARVESAMRAPAVRAARDEAVGAFHRFIIGAARGDDGPLEVRGSQVVLDLGDIVTEVATALDPRLPGLGLASLPTAKTTIVLGDATQVRMVRDGLSLLDAARIVIPLVVLAVILAIVGLAHRRTRALGIVGVAIMLAGIVSMAVAWAGGGVVSDIPEDPAVGTIVGDVYDAFVGLLMAQSLLLIGAGAALAVVAWVLQRRQRRRAVARMLGPRDRG